MIDAFLLELDRRGKSPHTVDSYRLHLTKFAQFCEENQIDFYTMRMEESKRFRNWLVDCGLKPASVNAILAAVSSFYTFLVETELVRSNPFFFRSLRVSEPERLPRFLTVQEEKQLQQEFEKLPKHIGLAYRTMLATGIRVGEAATLETTDVFPHNGCIFLRVRGKKNKERLVPVMDARVARELFALSQNRVGKLFGVVTKTLKWYAYHLKKQTGLDFYCHRLRHTVATRLLAHGTSLDVVQELLGHSSIITTRRYARTAPEKLLELAARM